MEVDHDAVPMPLEYDDWLSEFADYVRALPLADCHKRGLIGRARMRISVLPDDGRKGS